MPPSRDDPDDVASAATSHGTSAATSLDGVSTVENRRGGIMRAALSKLFKRFEKDATGTVHRAWGAAVLLMLLFFIYAIIVANKLREDTDSALTLQVAAYFSAAVHLILIVLGTFVLKRFSTAFAVGSFVGITLVLSQQNLLMFAAFLQYGHGNHGTNVIFANLSFMLFVCLGFFTLLLVHFKKEVIVV